MKYMICEEDKMEQKFVDEKGNDRGEKVWVTDDESAQAAGAGCSDIVRWVMFRELWQKI